MQINFNTIVNNNVIKYFIHVHYNNIYNNGISSLFLKFYNIIIVSE